MPIAEATSRYVLEDHASPALRSIRQEAERTTVAAKAAGEELDRLGSRERVRKLSALDDKITDLRDHMAELGSMDATPSVDIGGITRARGELAALRRELDSFDRQRATATVGVNRSGGGGGLAGGAARTLGGGGGGRSGRGLLDLGRRGLQPRNLAIGAGLAFLNPLLGSAGALTSVAGGAALGAGAIGATGIGTGLAGVAGVASVAVPAVAALKQAKQAQDAYNVSLAVYGARSTEARTAKLRLDAALAHTPPGGGRLLREQAGLGRDWRRLTQPGQASLFGLGANVIGDVRGAAPELASFSNRINASVAAQGSQLGAFAVAPQQMLILRSLTSDFTGSLGHAENTAEHLVTTFGNIARASSPFFREGMEFVDHWTGQWATSTSDIDHTRTVIGRYVQDLRDVGQLAGSAGRLVRDLLTPGQAPGRNMVEDLTQTLDRWDTWAQRNPEKLRGFFREGVQDTERLAKFLGIAVTDLDRMLKLLDPILGRFLDLANLAGGAGLLLPTAVRMGAGALLGRRGGGSGRGAAAGVPMVLGGGGAVGGVAAGGGAAAAAGTVGYLTARRVGRNGLRGYGGLATPEEFTQRFGGVEGARFGGPTSSLGSRRYGLGRVAAPARALGSRALRFGGPLLLANAAIEAATTQGTAGDRVAAAISGATLGIVPGPVTAQQRHEAALSATQAFVQQRVAGQPFTVSGAHRGQAAIRDEIARLQGQQRHRISGSARFLGGGDASFFGLFSTGSGTNDIQFAENQQRIKQLRGALDQENAVLRSAMTQRRRLLNEQSRESAYGLVDSFQQAFRIERQHGHGPADAMGDVLDDVYKRMRKMRPAGAQVLGENMLAWGREMEKHNPQLRGVVDDLADKIERRFSRMGQRVKVVDGQILTGSTAEWKQIRDAVSAPAEQARERVTAAFTAIQRQAVGSLQAMGFSASEARSIVRGAETVTRISGGNVSGGQALNVARGQYAAGQRYAAQGRNRRARGGMVLPGHGLADSIPLGNALVAPGESWISNRQTTARLDAMLGAAYGTSLGAVIGSETTPHWAPQKRYAFGGLMDRSVPAGARGGAQLAGIHPGIRQAALDVLARFPLTVTSTTSGGHAAGSYHYRGEAVDLAGSPAVMLRAASWIDRVLGASLTEGIHNPNLSIKGGRHVPPGFWGSSVWAGHANHIHLAVAGALGALGAAGGSPMAGALGRVNLRAPRSGLHGVPGALADQAGAMYAGALEQRINRQLGTMSGAGFVGGGGTGGYRSLGRRMMLAHGWGMDQWPALNALWTRESGWNPAARNPSSGAFGIPQALGHGFIGNDARSQIAWGLNYIAGRYGSPSAAWGHEESVGWYGDGGDLRVKRPTVIGVGDHPRGESVSIRRLPIGPPSSGRGGGRGQVIIQRIDVTVTGGVQGMSRQLRREVRDEVYAAFGELADELDDGMGVDEGATLE